MIHKGGEQLETNRKKDKRKKIDKKREHRGNRAGAGSAEVRREQWSRSRPVMSRGAAKVEFLLRGYPRLSAGASCRFRCRMEGC